SQALRKLSGAINRSNTIPVLINQLSEKVGDMIETPKTTPGGRTLKFYSQVRVEVRRAAAFKQETDREGNKTRIKIVKNKVATPFKQAIIDIMYGEGISLEGEILDMGSELEVIEKSGAWYSYQGERLGQGRENAKQFLLENEDIKETVYK